jgi:hypothetical protein
MRLLCKRGGTIGELAYVYTARGQTGEGEKIRSGRCAGVVGRVGNFHFHIASFVDGNGMLQCQRVERGGWRLGAG